MAISQSITVLPTPPSRADPDNFDARADGFLGALPTMQTQMNTWAGQANSTATTVNDDRLAAQSAKTGAESARDTASGHASTASGHASTATTQAGTATTQAGIATTQAGIATTQAGIATTQAGTATTQAGTATTQAGIATTQAGLAATAKTNAETAESHAETAQGLAEAARDTAAGHASTATTQAGTATTQAGIAAGHASTATTQAGTATTQAGIATTQAGIATTQAGIATTQAGLADTARQAAEDARDDAQSIVYGETWPVGVSMTEVGYLDGVTSAIQSQLNGKAASAAGVTNGDSHDHSGGDGAQIAYANLSGTPTLGTAAAAATTDFAAATKFIAGAGALTGPAAPLTIGTAAAAATGDFAAASHNQAETTITFTDVTTGNASTTAHGYAPKATAPASGLVSVLAIGNGETVRSDKALFDTTNPAALGSVGPGTAVVAARRDHVHAMPSAADVGAAAATSFIAGAGALTGPAAPLTIGTAAAAATGDFAPAAKGVTNGDSHDHNGGDGAQIAYSSLSGTPSVRAKLTADLTYYVRSDGSNSNTGLANTSGDAFLTIQKAYESLASLDLAGFTGNIVIGQSGQTFTAGIYATIPITSGPITLNLGGSTISTTNATALYILAPMTLTVSNGTLTTASSGSGMEVRGHGSKVLIGSGITFGACADYHIRALFGGFVGCGENYAVTGGAVSHIQATGGGVFEYAGVTVTLSGTCNFTSFVYTDGNSIAVFFASSFTGGTVTGSRYTVSSGGYLMTFGGGANYFPGDSAGVGGTTTGGGYYA